jgi:hypothetical protein
MRSEYDIEEVLEEIKHQEIAREKDELAEFESPPITRRIGHNSCTLSTDRGTSVTLRRGI